MSPVRFAKKYRVPSGAIPAPHVASAARSFARAAASSRPGAGAAAASAIRRAFSASAAKSASMFPRGGH